MTDVSAIIPVSACAGISREETENYVKNASQILRGYIKDASQRIHVSYFDTGTVLSTGIGAVLAAVALSKKPAKSYRWLAGIGAGLSGMGAIIWNRTKFKADAQIKEMADEMIHFVDRFDRDQALRSEFVDFAAQHLTPNDVQQKDMAKLTAVRLLPTFAMEKKYISSTNKLALGAIMASSAFHHLVNALPGQETVSR